MDARFYLCRGVLPDGRPHALRTYRCKSHVVLGSSRCRVRRAANAIVYRR